MHKNFYASGFFFHLASQQILLYQPNQKNNTPPVWSLLGGEGKKEETAEKAFQRIARSITKAKLALHEIRPVYDYFHNTHKKTHFVFYVQIAELKNFRSREGTLSWFTFKQTLKLPFMAETKQDLIVAERVIRAQARDDEIKIMSQLVV